MRPTIRHLPFLDALGSANERNDPVWRDASAGYLTLRFFDDWLENGPATMAREPSLAATRAWIRSNDVEPHVRHLLLTAINTLVEAEDANPAPVSGPLLAYGGYLDSVGRVKLAAHVYKTVAEALDASEYPRDPVSTATTYIQHGFAARRVSDFDEATTSYERAIEIGRSIDNLALVLRAQAGLASLRKAKGDLPGAESLLDRAVSEVDAALAKGDSVPADRNASNGNTIYGTGPTSARDALAQSSCLVRQARGAVRQASGRHVEAIQDFYTALQFAFDTTQREVILGDLAACAAEAGFRKTARDAYRVLIKTVQAPVVRSLALINLLELVVLDNDKTAYDQLRRDIDAFAQAHSMNTEHTVYSALYAAYGTEQFEDKETAVTAYEAVMNQARAAQIHQAEFIAEERLNGLLRASAPAPLNAPPVRDVPETLREVADAIAELVVA